MSTGSTERRFPLRRIWIVGADAPPCLVLTWMDIP